MTPAKKSILAIAMVAPLALAACSSDSSDEAAAPATVTSTSAAPSSAAPSSAAPKPEENKPSENAPAPENKETPGPAPAEGDQPAGDGAAPETLVNPFENGQNPVEVQAVAPLEGGQDADQGTIDAITNLNKGMYETTNLKQMTQYLVDNTCQAVLDQQPDLKNLDMNQFSEVPFSQLGVAWDQTQLAEVKDVKVDGDQASATVTVNTAQGPDTSTQRFRNEGGSWKYCN